MYGTFGWGSPRLTSQEQQRVVRISVAFTFVEGRDIRRSIASIEVIRDVAGLGVITSTRGYGLEEGIVMQTLVEGWTERETQLFADGVVFDLSEYTISPAKVEMLLYSNAIMLLTPLGATGVDDPANGIVYFDPFETDLVAVQSPYSVRWKVTDSFGKSAFFPNDVAEQWVVKKP